jgi:hypothetical protein
MHLITHRVHQERSIFNLRREDAEEDSDVFQPATNRDVANWANKADSTFSTCNKARDFNLQQNSRRFKSKI